ncbi:MAG: M1 family aminopeptidase [Myxococcota bacterium]
MLLVAAALAVPPPDALLRGDAAATREVFKHAAAPAPPPHADSGWDVTRYTLDVRIDPAAHSVVGQVTVTAERTGTGDLVLHADGPVIGAVRVDGVEVTPTVADDEVRVRPEGDTTVVEVAWTYDDARPNGIQWGRDAVYSFHEPVGARTWLPVHDHPADKAALDWIVTAPEGWVVAANGTLLGATTTDGWTTWRYTLEEPIATYLMAVHLADYVLTVSDGDIPVHTWAYRGREAEAAAAFADTPEMLAHFSALYGPYAFASYGNAVAPFATAMEHTTCVTFSDALVGTEDAPLVNAHELGHHWWGNDVTLGAWADIWLNEGFATYTELLWYEHLHGDEGRRAYAEWLSESFYAWQDLEGRFPLYDPLYMWGGVVYDKGGLVVHMLRGVLGDDRFFAALRAYEAEFHLGNATTADLEASLERSAGEDLGWFFDQWVYGVGEPTYTWGWAVTRAGEGWQLDVAIDQDLPDFRMPVPVRVTYADGASEDVTVEVTGAGTQASWCVDREPVGVTLDPDRWVMRAREAERAVAPAASVCAAPAAAAGCGCDTGRGALAPSLLLGALAVTRRRRA